MRCPCIACAWFVTFLAPVNAQESDLSTKKSGSQWASERQAAFASYEFQLDSESLLKLEPRPVLNWSNAERDDCIGSLHIWTRDGQPQLIACAYTNRDKIDHEFQSLAAEPIVARRNSHDVHRFDPGVEWQDLARAPKVADKTALRLVQMREQAQRFHVAFGQAERWSDARLLTQPVFVSPDKSVAVFVFVQGTDPECTLILKSKDSQTWQYALARQTSWGLKVRLDDKEVWGRVEGKVDSSFVVLTE